ncbi:MAG: hypothetical protein KKE39_02565 [Bacteroidetes bacterium]|nr:hypothetical protein [Bacteroidota bacterium]MBU1372287.1 hypothetical protein [Bacteroidota bacterium]MBU1486050.1 hypothetical protein [Bacteroidota bacterium]MBU1759482.1 hypothetical protein [Bacteroidota bacterium]MBU2046899.1 hypothetical protein [Bacteroidota bacterium]
MKVFAKDLLDSSSKSSDAIHIVWLCFVDLQRCIDYIWLLCDKERWSSAGEIIKVEALPFYKHYQACSACDFTFGLHVLSKSNKRVKISAPAFMIVLKLCAAKAPERKKRDFCFFSSEKK